jgi:hypothetical protein
MYVRTLEYSGHSESAQFENCSSSKYKFTPIGFSHKGCGAYLQVAIASARTKIHRTMELGFIERYAPSKVSSAKDRCLQEFGPAKRNLSLKLRPRKRHWSIEPLVYEVCI